MIKPSIDFGYPTPACGRIPAFNTIEDEAEFWDTHDFTDYLDESRPIEIEVGPELAERFTLRLGRAEQAELVSRAEARGTDAAALARAWIEERLRQESDPAAKAS